MRAVVAGGSLGGLMAGLELRAAGVDVTVHERSSRVLDDRGAGIVMQAETQRILTQRCGLQADESGVWLTFRQYLDRDGTRARHHRMPQLMTAWGLLYRALRRAFPDSAYHEGDALTSFEPRDGGVTAQFEKSGTVDADLLVGADGARSRVRAQLLPEVRAEYAGYVAWRGVVPEARADPELLETFGDHFTFQEMRGSHILCYLIPGADGEITPGARRLNWVWYWNVDADSLGDFMTGRDGVQRDFSMPPGQMQEKFVESQTDIATEVLSPQFQALWRATAEPFAQPIVDLAVPRMRSGRVVLTGDAAFVPRPHTAASTAKAAANAIALGEAVRDDKDVDRALAQWEPPQLQRGMGLRMHGQMLGAQSQFPV